MFANDTARRRAAGDDAADLRPAGGTYGVSGGSRRFDARRRGGARRRGSTRARRSAFTYQEAVWPHVTLQFGGRVEHQSFEPGRRPAPARLHQRQRIDSARSFRPSDATTVAVSVARAVRNPALEELYFLRPAPRQLRLRGRQRRPRRRARARARRGVPLAPAARHRRGRLLPQRASTTSSSASRPARSMEDFPVDRVHRRRRRCCRASRRTATSRSARAWSSRSAPTTSAASCATPASRCRGCRRSAPTIGARYRVNALQFGAQVVVDRRPGRACSTPRRRPPDAGVLKLFGVYSKQTKAGLHTITLRLDNATNETYRNHLSYIKDLVPERRPRASKLILRRAVLAGCLSCRPRRSSALVARAGCARS